MEIHKLVQLSLKALRREDETYLSYVHGKILHVGGNAHIKNADIKWTGVFFQTLKFFRFLQKKIHFTHTKPTNVQAFIYAGTNNQIKSMLPMVAGLHRNGIACATYIESNVSIQDAEIGDGAAAVRFRFSVIISALILFLIKAPSLYVRLRYEGNTASIRKYFNAFCMAYAYVPYFLQLLSEVEPVFVIQSNDHNVENRCLRLAAEMLGVKTVYLQHASVTAEFPPLEFDYAFLDGVDALEKYVACEQACTSTRYTTGNFNDVTIFLAGQQKNVEVVSFLGNEFCVGIGVNMMDEFIHLKELLDVLDKKGVSCVVRTHPYQAADFLHKLGVYINQHRHVRHSNSNESSLSDFFARCSILIAADSGLHLEAAIAGLPTYYYEFGSVSNAPDYYGFVRAGISLELPSNIDSMSVDEIMNLVYSSKGRSLAIKRYSESFGSRWQSREGELVAATLVRLLRGQSIVDFYDTYQDNHSFKFVYRLKGD